MKAYDFFIVALGDFLHKDNEFLDFIGLCCIMLLIAMGVSYVY